MKLTFLFHRPGRRLATFVAAAATGFTLYAQQPAYDLVIRHGRVVDGTGNPSFIADVAIRGDRIAAIRRLPDAMAAREIEARNLVVAPGFIDLHTHSDLPLINDGNAESNGRTSPATGRRSPGTASP